MAACFVKQMVPFIKKGAFFFYKDQMLQWYNKKKNKKMTSMVKGVKYYSSDLWKIS